MTDPSRSGLLKQCPTNSKLKTMVTSYTRKPKNVFAFLRNRIGCRRLVWNTFCRTVGADWMRCKPGGGGRLKWVGLPQRNSSARQRSIANLFALLMISQKAAVQRLTIKVREMAC
jgi:hypothetical protein